MGSATTDTDLHSLLSEDPDLPSYQTNGDAGPPSYSRATVSRERAEHVYHLMTSSNKPWATLKFHSAARSPGHMPVFFEGNIITGTFELDVNKDHILEIAIIVAGRIVTSEKRYNSAVFLNLSQIVWSRSMGDPKLSATSETVVPYTKKLHGHYAWLFTLPLPPDVTLSSDSTPNESPLTFRLPPTFLERNPRISVNYDIYAHIRRGNFRAYDKLGSNIVYVPCIKPEPPSPLRQLAYREGSAILGPEIDPDGWKTLKTASICGTIFKARATGAKCTLSLAKPLCYTRGTAIPCIMIIKTPDAQALNLLSSPRAVVVRLQRRVAYNADEATHRTDAAGERWHAAVDYPGTAVFWPGPTCDGDNCRRLDGEIQLSKYLKPSSAMMHFSITYHVMVFPFKTTAFDPADKGPVLAEKVEIGTLFAEGPRAKVYSNER